MLLQHLKSSTALDVVHFPTLDEFRSIEHTGEFLSTPLSGSCSAARASMALPNVHLTVLRTFPRILEVGFKTSGTICIVPLSSVDLKINGWRGSETVGMVVNGSATCDFVELQTNYFAIVNLNPGVSDRGWLEEVDRPQFFRAADEGVMRTLQQVIVGLVNSAAFAPEQVAAATARQLMDNALLSSIDDVMISSLPPPSAIQRERYLRIIRRVDEYLANHPASDIYITDLARVCDVSPRTLHSVIKVIRGLSVHRYLRLRRLWSVRRTLALGRPLTQISRVARANGFWHMGEFSSLYRSTFGETPSETLARNT